MPDLEQRLSTLQTEMDRLRHAPPSGLSVTEERLSRLTDECAEIVRRWSTTSERHALAVQRFEAHLTEWSEAGTRLQQDASQRIQELERLIHHEWGELKQLHEEPIRQLAEHATSLTQVCIATANVAQQGFERSEARLAAIEGDLNVRLTDLTRELQAVVSELRTSRGAEPRLPGGATPWPLDGVTRLHDQLREADAPAAPPIEAGAQASAALPKAPVVALLPEAASALTERLETLERTVTEHEAHARDAAQREVLTVRAWQVAAAALAVMVVLAAAFLWKLQSDVNAVTVEARQAQRDQQAAADAAAREVTKIREDAARQTAEARDRAERAQTIGSVLAAPDLVRYNLVGRAPLLGASAQVHWSPSRGVVFSGSGLPPAPPQSTYQIWLLTRAGPVSAGVFPGDATGSATVAARPPAIARPVIGAFVTLESAAGAAAPSGTALLARAPVSPVPELQ